MAVEFNDNDGFWQLATGGLQLASGDWQLAAGN
jgi:hypothetical protein